MNSFDVNLSILFIRKTSKIIFLTATMFNMLTNTSLQLLENFLIQFIIMNQPLFTYFICTIWI